MAVAAINQVTEAEIPGAKLQDAKVQFQETGPIVQLDYEWNGFEFSMAYDLLAAGDAKTLIAGVKEECANTLRDLADAKIQEVIK